MQIKYRQKTPVLTQTGGVCQIKSSIFYPRYMSLALLHLIRTWSSGVVDQCSDETTLQDQINIQYTTDITSRETETIDLPYKSKHSKQLHER